MATSLDKSKQMDMAGLALKIKDVDASGALDVTGNAAVTGTLLVTGAQTFTGNTTLTGDLTVNGGDIDAGASGTAGSVDIFPTTASKGKLAITCTDQTGNTTVSLVAGAMAGATTITLRDPGSAASFVTTTDTTGTAITTTVAELNKLDDSLSTNILTRGAGVDTAESYASGIFRNGNIITTRIVVDLSTLIGSATDLDIIGESAAADCHWGQLTVAKSGTLIGGQVTCLEVPAGGATDIDFYSATVSTGAQDVDVTTLTETVLITSGGAWASGTVKGMTTLPPANDYLYIVNGAASGGTFTAGKFLIEFYGYVA